jgi:hypothetical protein
MVKKLFFSLKESRNKGCKMISPKQNKSYQEYPKCCVLHKYCITCIWKIQLCITFSQQIYSTNLTRKKMMHIVMKGFDSQSQTLRWGKDGDNFEIMLMLKH